MGGGGGRREGEEEEGGGGGECDEVYITTPWHSTLTPLALSFSLTSCLSLCSEVSTSPPSPVHNRTHHLKYSLPTITQNVHTECTHRVRTVQQWSWETSSPVTVYTYRAQCISAWDKVTCTCWPAIVHVVPNSCIISRGCCTPGSWCSSQQDRLTIQDDAL